MLFIFLYLSYGYPLLINYPYGMSYSPLNIPTSISMNIPTSSPRYPSITTIPISYITPLVRCDLVMKFSMVLSLCSYVLVSRTWWSSR